jgi:hypothetical protein
LSTEVSLRAQFVIKSLNSDYSLSKKKNSSATKVVGQATQKWQQYFPAGYITLPNIGMPCLKEYELVLATGTSMA